MYYTYIFHPLNYYCVVGLLLETREEKDILISNASDDHLK